MATSYPIDIRAVLKIQKKIKFYHKVHKEIQTQSSQSIDFIGLGVLCVKNFVFFVVSLIQFLELPISKPLNKLRNAINKKSKSIR